MMSLENVCSGVVWSSFVYQIDGWIDRRDSSLHNFVACIVI